MKIFYFTSTGNSLAFAKQFDAELYSIPQLLNIEGNLIFEDDVIGFVFPTYAFTVPKLVLDFLERISLKSSYTFVVTTNEGGTGGTLSQFVKLARKKNININYANSLTTIGNYLPLSAMENTNTPSNVQKADILSKSIVKDISDRKDLIKSRSIILSSLAPAISRLYDKYAKDTAKSFVVESHCTNCGICAKVCPKKNITVTDTVRFNSKCISCYGCTHNCPQNAIRVKNEKSKTRYRNKEVSLSEIIDANNLL